MRSVSGHVFRVDPARGPVWYAKYRLPDGRQVQKRIGPAWTERGRPPAGFFTKRGAEEWLRDALDQARRGSLVGMVRTGASFADACAEFLRYVEHDRDCKPSTLRDLPLGGGGAPGAGLRRGAGGGRDGGDDRGLASVARGAALESHEEQAAGRAPRRLPAGAERLRAADEPGRRPREAPPAVER